MRKSTILSGDRSWQSRIGKIGETMKEYKEAKHETKKAKAKAKDEGYTQPDEKLNAKEGEKDLYRMVKGNAVEKIYSR